MPEASDRVGFCGLGNMGGPMATRLVAGGIAVLGFDPSSEACDRFRAHGGIVVDSTESLESTGVVILMLPNSDVVEEVVLRGGIADVLPKGGVVIDMSSSEPLRTQALASILAERGLVLIDAPVSGGVAGAENASLAIMVGGDEDTFETVAPLLSLLGSPKLVGPSGAGHALKALNNLLSAAHLWATSEAMLTGERFGLDPEVMLATINASSGRSGSTQNKWPDFILSGGFDSGFGLQLMLKDIKIATDLGHRLGVPIPLGDAVVDQWSRAAEALPRSADHTEIVRFLEGQTS